MLRVALLCVAAAPVANGATVTDLYSAAVPVADRSAAESERGVVRALAVVLKKITGRGDIDTMPAGRALLDRAQRYVTVIGHEAGGNDLDGWRLRVDFDARAIADALRARGVVLWGQQRPETYVWIVLDDAAGRRFVPETRYPELYELVKARAAERGIPLARAGVDPTLAAGLVTLPAANLLDALVGAPPAAEAPTSDSVTTVAPVQPPKLGGVLSSTDDQTWRGDWRIVIDGAVTDFQTAGDSPHAAVAAGVERAADALGAHFANPAVFGGDAVGFHLSVRGVRSAADYGRALRLLRELDVVTTLDVVRVTGDEVSLRLTGRGGLPALAESLRLGTGLVPTSERADAYVLAQ